MEGLVFTYAFVEGDPDPAVQSFIAAYRQRYREAPDYLAAQGYTVVRLLIHLAETSPTLTRSELPVRLLAAASVPGVPWFRGFNWVTL